MANKEVYRLDIKVGVTGADKAKENLTALEQIAEKSKSNLIALNKVKANPSAKVKDQASSTLDKIKSKTEEINKNKINTTAKVLDQASSTLDKIKSKTEKINESKVKPKLEVEDKASDTIQKTKSKTEELDKKKAKIKIQAQDEVTKTLNSVENKINGFIKTGAKKVITLGATGLAAIGGLGIGTSINTFTNFEKGLSNVKAVTGATNKEMQTLKDTAKALGASTEWSAVQVTQAEELLGQAGFSVNETTSALPGLLSLASAGDLDLAAATDIASGTLRSFGIEASQTGHVADVLALSASATNSDVTDLGETMKYVAPVSASLGISFEDTAAAAGLLSNQNIKGSQAGTVLRQTMARLASPTKEASEIMKKYGINAFDAQGNMKPLNGVVDNLNKSLGKLTSQQRADVISTIFGTESMSGVLALMNQGGQSLDDLSSRLKGANDAAKDMANTKIDNLSGQWKILKSAVEGAQIELGEKLAPYAKQFVSWLTVEMPNITNGIVSTVDYISTHTEELKSFIGVVTGTAIAFTGLSAVGKVGNAVSGVSKLVGTIKGAKVAEETVAIAGGLKNIGAIGKLLPMILSPAGLAITGVAVAGGAAIVANNNLMKKSLATTTEELGPLEKMMNVFHGHMYKSKSEMQDLGLIYEDFGDNISDNFKKKVQESTKSIREFQLYINKINLDGVIDDSESNDFDNKVNEMCYSAIKTIEDNKAKSQEGMKAMFMDDGTLSEAEQATLDYLSRDYDTKITAEQTLRDEIYQIKKDALADHKKLNDEEIQQIKEKQSQMAQIELESAGGTKEERAYSKNKFKARAEGLGLEDGSALAQEAAKDRDERIYEIKAKYDTYLDELHERLANTTDETEKQNINTSILENEKAEIEQLGEVNKLWNDEYTTLINLNSDLKDRISKYDGTILGGKDLESQNTLEKMQTQYKDISTVKQDGFYGFRNNNTNEMNSIYVDVDERTGEIIGAWNATKNQVGAYTTEIADKIKQMGDEHQNTTSAAIKYLGDMQASYNSTSQNIVTRSGESIGELTNITTTTSGLKQGIIDVNGTPLQVTVDDEGAITSVTNILDILNQLDGKVVNTTIKTTQATSFTNEADGWRILRGGYATGTNNATKGVHPVAENGFEIVTQKQNRFFKGGEKVLNHEQSKSFLLSNNEHENNVKQARFQVAQPSFQLAGVGNGIRVGDINVNINGNQEDESIIEQVTQVVGRKLKEALSNIKK